MQVGREKMLEWIQSGPVKREHEKVLETKHMPSKMDVFQHMHAVGCKNALHGCAICSIFAFLCFSIVNIRQVNSIELQSVIYDFKQNNDYLGGGTWRFPEKGYFFF